MQWEDNGIVLKYRNYSEKLLIASIFTEYHGRVDGMISRTKSSMPQPGDLVAVHCKARLEQHMGALKLETKKSNSSLLFLESTRVYALKSMYEMLSTLLPEHHPYKKLWQKTNETIQIFYDSTKAIKNYCFFEMIFIEELGFGLSLDSCAVTGVTKDLSHVSPKTGRAVCYQAAKPYITKLLPLPQFLHQESKDPENFSDYVLALQLTGYFLLHHIAHNRNLPLERNELISKIKAQINYK